MNRPCATVVPCEDPAFPVGNYSSEAQEVFLYDSLVFPIWNPGDPIGGDPSYFTAESCLGECSSQVSQQDADQCAARAAFVCAHTGTGTAPPAFSYSSAQTCTLFCPDGTPFTYTLPAGAVVALSQAAADSQAAALACLECARLLACMPALPQTEVCANQAYSVNLTMSGPNRGPWTFDLVDGSLPQGITMTSQPNGTTFTLTGTATQAGNTSFTVQASNASGVIIQKTYHLNVLGVQPDSMPAGTLNSPYTMQFTASGGVGPYTFTLSVPQQDPPLPCGAGSGFTAQGLFSCTPTQNGVYNLDITVTDSKGTSCTRAYTWQVGYCNTEQSATGFCPGNPQIAYHATIPQGAYCAGTQLQAETLAQQALVNQISQGLQALGCTCTIMVTDVSSGIITTTCPTTAQVLDTNGHVIGCLPGNGVGVFGLDQNHPLNLQAAWNINCAGNINVPVVVGIAEFPQITFAFGN